MVKVTNRLSYKLGHVLLDGGISENTRVTAGHRLGTTSPEAAALDLWVMNLDIAIGFITPGRYPSDSINCDKPLKYFSDDLRAPLYAKVTGVNADKDGRIDYDQPGGREDSRRCRRRLERLREVAPDFGVERAKVRE